MNNGFINDESMEYLKNLSDEDKKWVLLFLCFLLAGEDGVRKVVEDMETEIKARDKQTPKKVTNGTCPNCNRIFLFRHGETRKGNYCDNCGEALIWED